MADSTDIAGLTCAWCGKPIARRGRRGPAPSYCPGSRCRVAAHRARADYADWTADRPDVLPPAPGPHTTSPPVEQVAAAVLEAHAVAASFIRLGNQSPPPLAWRCARFGRVMSNAIDRLFPAERSRS
jgi:hypothetical protein